MKNDYFEEVKNNVLNTQLDLTTFPNAVYEQMRKLNPMNGQREDILAVALNMAYEKGKRDASAANLNDIKTGDPGLYILRLWMDIEPNLHGPYATEEERDEAAKEIAIEYPEDTILRQDGFAEFYNFGNDELGEY